jgi:hypothetical protein
MSQDLDDADDGEEWTLGGNAGGDDDAYDGDDADDDVKDEDEDEDGPSEIERLAIEAGWKPRAAWKGQGWVPADQFLRGQVARSRSLARKEREFEDRIDRLDRANEAALQQLQRDIKARVQSAKRAVIAEGEDDAAEVIEEIDRIAAEQLAELSGRQRFADGLNGGTVKLNALDQQFFREHGWMLADDVDQDLADDAFELAQKTVQAVLEKTGDIGKAHERAAAALRRAFPQAYQAERMRGRRAPDLAGGAHAARSGARGASYALPPEARRAGERYVKEGLYQDMDAYARVYFAETKKGRG